ncbi:hypothetical protein BASA81_015821 [Batrachochytrium salamandrivorans]|nr:hypothetical protein BASA81_015821 [Batrachochytrium salamandrivorans]
MSDPLLWVLHHFVIYYAGQTTQGNKDGVNGANQASGSNHNPKQDTDLPLRADYLSLKRPLQESNILDQSGAPSSGDFQLEVECTGRHRIRKISKSCSQQPSQPELRPSTSYDSPQSDEMSLPAYAGESEVESYRQGQNTDQYREFIAGENKYFKSEYLFEDILGKGDSAMVYLATKKYNGMKVAYKSILKKPVEKYAFESNPRPRCHIPSPLVGSDEQSVAQCMSSRPPNLLIPHEFALQMYLSRPGRENPYVPMTFDYITLEDEYILVMEHLDEKWSTLSKYVEKKGQLDIEEARNIIKEIVNGMISLKNHGVVHEDLNADNVMYNKETNQVKLIDFGVSGKLPGWEGGKSVPLKSSDPPSTASEYKAETDELQSNKDDDDGANQASGSNHNPKQDTGLPLRVHPIDLSGFLRRLEAPDQNGASSSVDPQLGNGSKVPRWLRNLFGSSTSDDSPQSNKMPLPAYAGKAEVESYSKNWETDQYREFIAGETEYFTSEYLIEKEIGTGSFGIVYRATRKSDGKKVAYKSIPKSKIRKYALEPNPPPICNLRNPLVGSDEQSVAQCMSSRPPNLPFPYEVMLQTYLSRPGRENPYVPTTFDYIALEGGYILFMEYLDEKWIALSSYAKKKRRLDIEEARNIIKEIVNGMISLKQQGVVHGDLNGMSQ